ncbi:MAG: transposase [Bacteroidales bacterium]|nr:transposase [Bacteroidales bacterium]
MKSQKRPFQRNVLNHCYQRTVDGGVLFYSQLDYLVWFTIVCTVARKRRVRILAMCPMPDHTHFSIEAASLSELAAFMRDYSSIFAAEHNKLCHRSGPLFDGRFGSAIKNTDKKVRTNLIYVWNNPPERKLVVKAEEYRWNFLAYAVSDHPFSNKLVIRNARWPMQKAVKEIKAMFKKGQYLAYALLKRLFNPLTQEEKQQLTDYIISIYNVIDYRAALSFFNSYDDLLVAVHSTTGAEHDIKELDVGKSDHHYNTMVKTILKELKPNDIHDILGYTKEEKYEVFKLLRKHSYAMSEQIAKFLHMNMVKL